MNSFWSRTLWVGEEEPSASGDLCGLPGFHLSVTVSYIGDSPNPLFVESAQDRFAHFSPILR